MSNQRSDTPRAEDLPLVSIVTPTYNQADFLRETIESVISQDYPRIEYLVIDDGSTDSTRQILAEYDGRVHWESRENRGQTPTINEGWERSTGDIVTWLNSDDLLLPGAVTTAVNYLREHPEVGIVFGDTMFTAADGTDIERSKPREQFDYREFVLKCENPIAQPSAFIRRSVVEDVGLLDPFFYYFMDWDFWLRAGVRHRIEYFPELLSTYRLHPDSKTVAQAAKAAPELQYLYDKFFALPDLPAEIRALEKRAKANMFFTSGGYYLEGGKPRLSARVGWRALRAHPLALLDPKMMHKFFYCLFGGTPIYQGSRSALHRARATLGESR
jgi:glycosyltransferase involved in cell wall biosynthesis